MILQPFTESELLNLFNTKCKTAGSDNVPAFDAQIMLHNIVHSLS